MDRTNTWLSFAETKNAALIAFDVAMLAIFADMYSTYTFFSTLLMVIFLASGAICLWSFSPILSNYPTPLRENRIPKNLLFWADIAIISTVDDYLKQTIQRYYPTLEFANVRNNKNIDLVSEILINSRITNQKYILFKIALYLDLFAFGIVIAVLIIA